MKRLIVASLLALLCAAYASAQGGRVQRLRSPGGKVEVAFSLDAEGAPVYAVSYRGREVIRPSGLGLVFKQGGLLSRGMRVTGVRRRAHDSVYELAVGKTRLKSQGSA